MQTYVRDDFSKKVPNGEETQRVEGEVQTVSKRAVKDSEKWPFIFGVKHQKEILKQCNQCDFKGWEYQWTSSTVYAMRGSVAPHFQ